MMPEEEVNKLNENVVELFRCARKEMMTILTVPFSLYELINKVTVKCGLKAGGRPQAEICWKVDSNGEVCSEEGPEILLLHTRETCRSCFGEDTFSQ